MKRKLMVAFLLLLPMVNVFYSCVCPDVITKYEYYSHRTLLLKNLDNTGAQSYETDALQINKNAYGIRLHLRREIEAIALTEQTNSPFVQSAYAMSFECPPEYIFSANDSIVSIKIFTIHPFDDLHPANSDITDYFSVFSYSYSTVEDYVAYMWYTFESDVEFERLDDKEFELDLLLMSAPTADNPHQFKVQVELSDNRVLEQLTTEIELL